MRERLIGVTAAVAACVIAIWVAQPAAGQPGDKRRMPEAPKGQPTPKTADGHPDFTGVYHAPGYGPSDPAVKNGETVARNIARDLKPDDVPMLPSAMELFKNVTMRRARMIPKACACRWGLPARTRIRGRSCKRRGCLILYEGNVHSYRQVFLDGRKHDPDVIDTWWGDSVGTWDGDALVVDTVGINAKSWLDLVGHPARRRRTSSSDSCGPSWGASISRSPSTIPARTRNRGR